MLYPFFVLLLSEVLHTILTVLFPFFFVKILFMERPEETGPYLWTLGENPEHSGVEKSW